MSADDVIMFTMDERIDRRILLAAGTLIASGLSVRVYAPARGAAPQEPAWVSRIALDAQGSHGLGLRLYRLLRDRLPFLRPLLRFAVWRVVQRPQDLFSGLFAPVVASAAAPVYVAHDLPMLPVALAARARHGGKVLYDSHELYPEQEFSEHERDLWRRTEAELIGQADAVITVNDSIADEMARRYGIARPTVVTNAETFRPAPLPGGRLRRALGWDADVPLVLYQGGLSPNRNIHTLVAAFRHLRHPSACLAVLGDGAVKPELERLVNSLGIGSRVRFHPAVPQDELPGMTADADIGVIPYRATCLNNLYCTPNKLYEFVMARLPVVASDLPELRRVVAGGGLGLVGDTATPESFAALLDEALAMLAQRKTELRAAAEDAAHRLSWDVEGPKYRDAVLGLLEPAR